MDRKTKLPGHVPLAVATRGDTVESVHYGSIAVADANGQLLHGVGDTQFPVFTRSTLKPFQALPFILSGGPVHFGFSSEQVALTCASHSGEPRHVAAVADMLARIGCSEADLQCGSHAPFYYAATDQPVPCDQHFTALHHNCSGKHAGFLAWCRQHDQPTANYLSPDHPLQQAIRHTLAQVAGLSENDMPMGIDGCSAPNYALPLSRLAAAYARLAAPADDTLFGHALATAFSAMTGHPEMVAGEGRGDLLLMQAAPGDWVAKAGAEGMQALGISSRGWGVAIKIADGNARVLRVVVDRVLEQLGVISPVQPQDGEPGIFNHTGYRTGCLAAVFDLA